MSAKQSSSGQSSLSTVACVTQLLNEKLFNKLDDARRKMALWRYDYNNVRLHSSLENQTLVEARRVLDHFEAIASCAMAQNETTDYKIQTRKLSL